MTIRKFGSRALIPLILISMGLAGWHAASALGQVTAPATDVLRDASAPRRANSPKAGSLDSTADAYIEHLGDDDQASRLASMPVRRIRQRPVPKDTGLNADEQAVSDTATTRAADRASNEWIIAGALMIAGLAASVFVGIWALKPGQQRKHRHVAEILVLEMARNSTGAPATGRQTPAAPSRRAA